MPSRALSLPVFALQLDPTTDLSAPCYQKANRALAERVRHFVASFGPLPLENLQRDLSPKSTTKESDNPYFPDPSLPWEDQSQQPAEWSLTKHSLIEYERCSTRFRAAKELMDALDQIAKVRANSKGTLKDQREAAYYSSLLRWITLYALTNMPKETHVELTYLPKQAKSLSTTAKSSWQALVERFTDESGLDPWQTENEYGESQSYYDAYDYWSEHNSNADSRIYGISPSMMDLCGQSNYWQQASLVLSLLHLILSWTNSLPICASSSQPLIRTASTAGALTILRRFFLMIVIVGFVPSLLACRLTKNLQMQTPSQPHMRYICVA